MYLPTFKIQKIEPEMNVKFITNYLSKDKKANATMPFFDKTVALFPELACVNSIDNESDRNIVIKKAVKKHLRENDAIISERIEYFKKVFDSFIYQNIEAQCGLYDYKWSNEYPEIKCYVGYLPFYPRSAEDKCFFVSYQDEERVFSGAVHEINHMIFWEKWKEMFGIQNPEPCFPDTLWYLQEIIVDPTLNDERVKKYTLYENRAYPQFYVKKANELSTMDKIKSCYLSYKDDITGFIKEAYRIMEFEDLSL